MGLLLKSLAERRLEKEKEYDRERLRLEAAMRAGSLLATSEGVPASPATMAAGLLALTQLGQCELAVALLVDLWSEEKADHGCGRQHGTTEGISSETAVLTIDAALRSGELNAPLVAAELLCRNAERLDAC